VGAWLQDRLPLGRLSIEPGVRLDWNSYTQEAAWLPRLRVAARRAGATVWTGYAEQTQTPGHERLQGFEYFQLPESGGTTLRNERSRQVVVGAERALAAGFDLRVEAYRRRFDRLLVQRLETDAERAMRLLAFTLPPDLPADAVILERRPTVFPESTGRGTASGVELLLRRTGERVSGFVGYTFSRTMREAHGYTFPFDFDRPHTVSVAGTLRLASRLRLSLTALNASGFAITPLHQEAYFLRDTLPDGTLSPIARVYRNRDGSLNLAPNPGMRRLSLRNQERLAGYARADVRVTYASGGRWEFYGEVINVLDHHNYVQAMPVPEQYGGSQGITTSLNVYEQFERLPSFGVRFRF
jgi:outer membrane cobalamin receptor